MIKRIDARIAELEAMEKEEQENITKAKSGKQTTSTNAIPNVEFVSPVPMTKEMEEKFASAKKENNLPKKPIEIKETSNEISVEEKEKPKKEIAPKEKSPKKENDKKEEKKNETSKEETAKPKTIHEIGNKKELADKITSNINKNNESEEPVNNNYITDDQFFDDFFADDDDM